MWDRGHGQMNVAEWGRGCEGGNYSGPLQCKKKAVQIKKNINSDQSAVVSAVENIHEKKTQPMKNKRSWCLCCSATV